MLSRNSYSRREIGPEYIILAEAKYHCLRKAHQAGGQVSSVPGPKAPR